MHDASVKTVYLGLDISKRKIDCCILQNGQYRHFIIDNHIDGFFNLSLCLSKWNIDSQDIHACCEATGIYYKALAQYLHQHRIVLSVINPRSIHAYSKERMKRVKTDKQDAKLIAEYCSERKPEPWFPDSEFVACFKSLHRRVEQLNQMLVCEKNRLQVSDEYCIESVEESIEFLNREIKKCRDKIDEMISRESSAADKFRILQSIPGVGKQTARVLLYLLHNPDRFQTAKHLISFIGLSPTIRDSGQKHGRQHISKMGDRFIRKSLYLPARVACLHTELWRPWFEQKIREGKHPKQIYVLMMCKILKFAYVCIKTNTPFNPELHRHKTTDGKLSPAA